MAFIENSSLVAVRARRLIRALAVMNSKVDLMEKAVRNLGWRNKVRCGDRVIQIACLVREATGDRLKRSGGAGKKSV